MSHFVGLVFGYNYNELLEPYDENREVYVYIKYTKDDAINQVRQERIDTYEYALRVLERFPNPSTEQEQSNVDWAKKVIDKGIDISYEEAWKIVKEWGYEIDDEDNLLSTYNPDSKWDWYIEGGRWGAWLLLKEKDEDGNSLKAVYATKDEIDWNAMKENGHVPFCYVTCGGDWVESAEIGWFGMTSNEKDRDKWDSEFWEYIDTLRDDTPVTVIDFHI